MERTVSLSVSPFCALEVDSFTWMHDPPSRCRGSFVTHTCDMDMVRSPIPIPEAPGSRRPTWPPTYPPTCQAAWNEEAVRVEGSKKMLPNSRPWSRRSPPAVDERGALP